MKFNRQKWQKFWADFRSAFIEGMREAPRMYFAPLVWVVDRILKAGQEKPQHFVTGVQRADQIPPSLNWDLDRMKAAVESAQGCRYVLPHGLAFEEMRECIINAPFTIERDWPAAPKWAECVVQDAQGWLWWLDKTPVVHGESWVTQWDCRKQAGEKGPANPNWKLALEERPAALDSQLEAIAGTSEALRTGNLGSGFDDFLREEGIEIDPVAVSAALIEQYRAELLWRDLEIESLRGLCAAAYQALGAVDGPVEMLDNLSDAANGQPLRHAPEAGLPFNGCDAELGRLVRQYFISGNDVPVSQATIKREAIAHLLEVQA